MISQLSQPINLLENVKFKQFIEAFTALTQESSNLSLNEIRERCTNFFLPPDTIYEPVKEIKNMEISGRDQHPIPVRLFIPHTDAKALPVMIYLHRGGWVFGSIEEADPVCRKLANHLGCIIASVGYRHAPENPFPAPLNDAYDATQWIGTNAGLFGGDVNNIMICGESAGGNLAASVALMCRDQNGVKLTQQLLICPIISSTIDEAAYQNSADKYFITLDSMRFFWSMYVQDTNQHSNPYASPEKADNLSGLPASVIITAEHDPLNKEAQAYVKQLQDAGVTVLYKQIPDVIHGFIDLPIYEEKQKIRWIQDIGQYLHHNRQTKGSSCQL
jgi:acetyl esterase